MKTYLKSTKQNEIQMIFYQKRSKDQVYNFWWVVNLFSDAEQNKRFGKMTFKIISFYKATKQFQISSHCWHQKIAKLDMSAIRSFLSDLRETINNNST